MVGQWRGGLAGAGLIAGGGFLAPEVSAWLKNRRQRTIDIDQVSSPAVHVTGASGRYYATVANNTVSGGQLWVKRYDGNGTVTLPGQALSVAVSRTAVFVPCAARKLDRIVELPFRLN